MEIILSAAVTADGCMDDSSPRRLVISNAPDWAEVHRLRAECDAILVGAETLRRDDPALVIRDAALRSKRTEHGRDADLTKVVVSGSAALSPTLRFFTEGAGTRRIVICRTDADPELTARLEPVAEIVRLDRITAAGIAAALQELGIGRLMVEGGARTLRMFIHEDMADRMRLAVSPHTIGDPNAPHLPYFGALPFANRASATVRDLDGIEVYDYTIDHRGVTPQDRIDLMRAIELSRLSEPCGTAYRVGCVIRTADGRIFGGYTHRADPHDHAEEDAIASARAAGADLSGSTFYTSMEPCSTRASRPVGCSRRIIECGAAAVVYAYAEPECFVHCEGTRILRDAGVRVTVLPEYAPLVEEINAHIVGRSRIGTAQ